MFNCLSNLTTCNDNKWLYFQQNSESLWHDLAIKTHKIYPLYTPNKTLVRGKDLSNHLYDTLVLFAKPMNNISWLVVPTVAGQSGKQKASSEIQTCSTSTAQMTWQHLCLPWKRPFIFCGHRAEMDETQTQNIILWVSEPAKEIEFPDSQGVNWERIGS